MVDGNVAGAEDVAEGEEVAGSASPSDDRRSFPAGWVLLAGGLGVLALCLTLVGWLGYRAYDSRVDEAQRQLFLQVGRQAAINLTTIDHTRAEADVQRIIDGSTGGFREDFESRSAPFIEVVRQAESKSEGTVTEAGLESMDDDEGQVLVAVSVRTTTPADPEPQPRSWRMRITVQKDHDEAKVSNVEFVP
jgi:Mce-associated membrane protein